MFKFTSFHFYSNNSKGVQNSSIQVTSSSSQSVGFTESGSGISSGASSAHPTGLLFDSSSIILGAYICCQTKSRWIKCFEWESYQMKSYQMKSQCCAYVSLNNYDSSALISTTVKQRVQIKSWEQRNGNGDQLLFTRNEMHTSGGTWSIRSSWFLIVSGTSIQWHNLHTDLFVPVIRFDCGRVTYHFF